MTRWSAGWPATPGTTVHVGGWTSVISDEVKVSPLSSTGAVPMAALMNTMIVATRARRPQHRDGQPARVATRPGQ